MVLLTALGIAVVECTFISFGRWTTHHQYIPARIWAVIPLCWLVMAVIAALPSFAVSRKSGPVITAGVLVCSLVACRTPGRSAAGAITIWLLTIAGLVALRYAGPWWLSKPRRPALCGAVFALIFCVIATAVSGRRPARRPARAKASTGTNVILIFADTLRYDAVFDADGEVKRELPALRRLAGESVVFNGAYTAAPWTLPSHLAAVTGLPYDKLGVDFSHQQYTRSVPTLAERFRREGYRTAAVISNSFLNPGTNFPRGFDSYEYSTGALDVCRSAPGAIFDNHWPWFAATVCNWPAEVVTKRTLRQIDDAAGPYFLVVNYMDAHSPYYVEPGCGGGPPSYARAVRCIDRHLSTIINRTATSRFPTVIAFTSDHGEQFGERGLRGHGNSLYRDLLHVPLMIRMPSRTPARVAEPVSLSHLPALLKNPLPPPVGQAVVSSGIVRDLESVSVIRDRWQLIMHADGREETIALSPSPAGGPPLELMRHDAQKFRRSIKPLPEANFRSLGYEQ
jgi:arylsulfatase A-like enzyme